MRMWKPLAIGIGTLAVASATLVPVWRSGRGVQLVEDVEVTGSEKFIPAHSAALFTGVGNFSSDPSLNLRNAADDAVDLAFMFSLHPRMKLVPPERVVLALSGSPEKRESQGRLEELKRAGARVETASQADIVKLLNEQAEKVERNGILVVSLATHGFVKNDLSYVLGSDSILQDEETAASTARLLEIAAKSAAQRSLFLIDACRNRIVAGTRGPRTVTAAPLISRMGNIDGQIVFSAAPAGGYAWDGEGNGVFTKAVLEGLNCKASLRRGVVTFETLAISVDANIRKWLRKHGKSTQGAVTQSNVDGRSGNMPLAVCEGAMLQAPPDDVIRAEMAGSDVIGFTANGGRWSRTVDGSVLDTEVVDLDADGSQEVVAGAKAITVFDHTGIRFWSAGEDMTLRQFRIGDFLRKDPTRQIVALWEDERSLKSRVSIHASDGEILFDNDHDGRLRHLAVARPTSRHGQRIIVAGEDTVILFDSRRLVWEGVCTPPTERIERLEIIEHGKDGRAIAVSTAGGGRLVLDFSGKVIEGSGRVRFKLVKGKRR